MQTKHTTITEYMTAVRVLSQLPSELHKKVMKHIQKPPLFLRATLMPSGRTSTFRIDSPGGFYWHDAGGYGFHLGKNGDRLEAIELHGAFRGDNPQDQDVIVEITEKEYHEDNRGYYAMGNVVKMLQEWADPQNDDDDVPY